MRSNNPLVQIIINMSIVESSENQTQNQYLFTFVSLPAFLLCIWPNRFLALATAAFILIGIGYQITKRQFKPSFALTALLILFTGSSILGMWAAYQPNQALTKLQILIVAVLLALFLSNSKVAHSIISAHLAIGSEWHRQRFRNAAHAYSQPHYIRKRARTCGVSLHATDQHASLGHGHRRI